MWNKNRRESVGEKFFGVAIATSKNQFTEHVAVLLANVLNSPTAVEASILVVRAFVRLHEIGMSHKDLARKIVDLEKKYDSRFPFVTDAIGAVNLQGNEHS